MKLRTLGKSLMGAILVLVALACSYAGYGLWAWGDIPVAALEQQYGGEGLLTSQVDGLDVRYRLEGSVEKPVVVLIHNHFMDMGTWDAWLPYLLPDFQVLRYDLSGHGLTGPDASGVYTVDRDVALLDGLLRSLSTTSVALVGSSLGGNIAFTYAARHPDQVSALVLINSGGLKKPSGRRSGRDMPAWADWVLPLVPPSALHSFLTWMSVDDATIDLGFKHRFVDMWRREGNRTAELARLRQFEAGNPDPILAAVQAPTLLLWGADNPQLPATLADIFAEKLSSAASTQVKKYPGAGHILPVERAEASALDTLEFLRDHTLTQASQ